MQELSDAAASTKPLLTRDNLDLVFVNRLMESPPEQYPQQPFHYLLACFARSSSELRSMSPRLDAATQQQVQGTVVACRELIVQYASLLLTDTGVIPQVRSFWTIVFAEGDLQWLDALREVLAGSSR